MSDLSNNLYSVTLDLIKKASKSVRLGYWKYTFSIYNKHEPVLAILATLVMVVLIGTAAQILAERMRITATGPLLFAGLLFGQAGLGLRSNRKFRAKKISKRFRSGD